MRECAECGQNKADEHFRKAGRGLRVTCKVCEGREEGDKAVAARAPKVEALEPVVITGALEVPSAFGFGASIEDGNLQIEQDRPGDEPGQLYTHQLSLARHEAAQLIDWIAHQVETTEPAI